MSIERRFDVSLIAAMALREKQIQQNYRPIIGVHKWFARRPGTLFRGLLLAEFGQGRLEDLFFRANDFPGLRIADPFMGGGTPLIEANRVGCDVDGFDIHPMSAWIVREEIEHIDLAVYERAARALRAEIGRYYRTSCPRSQDRGLEHFTKGLSTVYSRMARALKPGAPLAFTYHHNKLDAYCVVGVAILDAGLVCPASMQYSGVSNPSFWSCPRATGSSSSLTSRTATKP